MNNMELIETLIEKIKQIEQEHIASEDGETKENRGKIVESILVELNNLVVADEN